MRNNNTPPIIALDGNHRSGKGTQLELLSSSLERSGYKPLILRGDGSRTGEGDVAGDPYSEWWRQFKEYAKTFENEYIPWRHGSLRLMAEAALLLDTFPDNGVVLFDRAGISRAQMTLREDMPVSLEAMYREHDAYGLTVDDIYRLQPDTTIFLSAPTDILIDRLDPHDPKYQFRKNNILVSNEYFERAYSEYRSLDVSAVHRISVDDTVGNIAQQIENVTINQI